MAQLIIEVLDHQWLANLPPALVPHLPTGPDESNQHLHKLINNAFNKQTNQPSVAPHGKSVLLSTTSFDSQEIHTTQHYG
jgi:hypothetical protein